MNAKKNGSEIVDDIRVCLEHMRRTLMLLCESIGLSHEQPEAVAGQLGIGGELSSQLVRMLAASDTFEMLRHMPWQKGLATLDDAFRKAGANEFVLGELRGLTQRFAELMSEAGGRLHVESQLVSMGLLPPAPQAKPQWQPGNSDFRHAMPKTLIAFIIGCCIGLCSALYTFFFPSSLLEKYNRLASAAGTFLGYLLMTVVVVIAIAVTEEVRRQLSER